MHSNWLNPPATWTWPTFDEMKASWASLKALPVEQSDEATARLVSAFEESSAERGCVTSSFAVEGDDALIGAMATNQWGPYEFVRRFLMNDSVRRSLPELMIPASLDRDLGFEAVDGFSLDGDLASAIAFGGPYSKSPLSAREIKHLAADFVEERFDGRYLDLWVFRSHQAWTPWFCDIAWDRTWLVVDKGQAQVFLLAVTATD